MTADLINKYITLNGGKCFSLSGQQNYLLFISTRHIVSIGNNTVNIKSWGSTGMSRELSKIHILQTLILLQRKLAIIDLMV